MKRTWHSLSEVREKRDRRQFNGGVPVHGAQRFQYPIDMPPVIYHRDKQTSMRLTLNEMVELNDDKPVAITIPVLNE